MRDLGREWVEEGTRINVMVDVSVIPSEREAHELLEKLVEKAHNQIALHFKAAPMPPKEDSDAQAKV